MVIQKLEDIHTIVVHCTATKEGVPVSALDIDSWHRAKGWSMIGYHRVIRLDGGVENGRPFFRRGAHVAGNNKNTLGFAMVGGLDSQGKSKNTFNTLQFDALWDEIANAKIVCPNITTIKGHRDFSPDLNGDGIITRNEWIKDCPCFDVQKWLEDYVA